MVLLSAQGMPVAKNAEVTFTSADRIRDVIHNFNADGFDSLYPMYEVGRPRTFTLPERHEIKKSDTAYSCRTPASTCPVVLACPSQRHTVRSETPTVSATAHTCLVDSSPACCRSSSRRTTNPLRSTDPRPALTATDTNPRDRTQLEHPTARHGRVQPGAGSHQPPPARGHSGAVHRLPSPGRRRDLGRGSRRHRGEAGGRSGSRGPYLDLREQRFEDGWRAGVRDVASRLLRIADTTATAQRSHAASNALLHAHLQQPASPAPQEAPVEEPAPAPAPVPALDAKDVRAAAARGVGGPGGRAA